jgi:hypothetical protein
MLRHPVGVILQVLCYETVGRFWGEVVMNSTGMELSGRVLKNPQKLRQHACLSRYGQLAHSDSGFGARESAPDPAAVSPRQTVRPHPPHSGCLQPHTSNSPSRASSTDGFLIPHPDCMHHPLRLLISVLCWACRARAAYPSRSTAGTRRNATTCQVRPPAQRAAGA